MSDNILEKLVGKNKWNPNKEYRGSPPLLQPPVNRFPENEASRIISYASAIDDYRDNYDIVKASEMQYERMRVEGNTNIIVKTIGGMFDKGEQVLKNTLGSISPMGALQTGTGLLKGKMKYDPIKGSLEREALASWGRAVGPIEELPVGDYIQDKYRAQRVLTTTMTGFFEHKVLANIMIQRTYISPRTNRAHKNKRTPLLNPGGDAQSYTHDNGELFANGSTSPVAPDQITSKEKQLAKDNLFISLTRSHMRNGDDGDVEIKNKYGFSNPYTESLAQQIDDTFTFSITNLAISPVSTMLFPAYIGNISESLSTHWSTLSLINRSEDLYIYERASRDFTIEFFLFGSTSGTNDYTISNTVQKATITRGFGSTDKIGIMSKKMMWDRLQFLHTLTRPAYSNGSYIRSPYCKLTIGNLFKNALAIVESISITYPNLMWDINVGDRIGIRPMVASISMNGKILHNTVPNVNTLFYPEEK